MFRYDKKSGETLNIKPRERKGEPAYKWNWDTPLFISPHSKTRLYVAANKVFRSDDRGNSWKVISEDLTAQLDRDSFKFMDKYWPAEAVVKHVSTSQWGTIVALDESTLQEDLLYAGTDDGVIAVTENAGGSWRQTKSFPGVPDYTFVSDVQADKFDANVVYAVFNNMKMDDFKPYVLKSTDKGKTWTSIAGNLPENHPVHTIQQDFKNPNLLFAGTEFGFFFTIDGGKNWVQLKSGLPTIPVRDIAIQERESDLAIATFGRGFYILDDYSPLRDLSHELAAKDAHIFPIKDAWKYNRKEKFDNQGSTFFKAANPDYGATFTYYVKEAPKTKEQLRKEKEKELFKEGEYIPQPTWRELELEGKQEKSHLLFTIYDAADNIVRQMAKAPSKGINRITWNLTHNSPYPVSTSSFDPLQAGGRYGGLDALPGRYKVGLQLWHEGTLTTLAEPVEFTVKQLNNTTFPATDLPAIAEFDKKIEEVRMAVDAAERLTRDLIEKVETIKQTLYATPAASQELKDDARALSVELEAIRFEFDGVDARASWEEIPPAKIPLSKKVSELSYMRSGYSGDPTETERQSFAIVQDEFPPLLERIKAIAEEKLPALEKQLDAIGAPWTPGRIPAWKN